jgi:hypothetical protein
VAALAFPIATFASTAASSDVATMAPHKGARPETILSLNSLYSVPLNNIYYIP